MTIQYEQTSWIPKTELDEATAVLAHLIEERKAKSKSLATAESNYQDAYERVTQQQHVVDTLQAQMPAAEPAPMEGEAEEDDAEEAEVVTDESHQIEGDVIDLETGEVTSKEENTEGQVGVWWPHDDELGMAEIGEHTQYAELVADYLASGDPDMASDDIEQYCVVGIGDGRARPLHAVIVPEDHGLEFAVVYGTAGDLEEDLRDCANCGAECSDRGPLADSEAAMGCDGVNWQPVPTDQELAEHEANMAEESAA